MPPTSAPRSAAAQRPRNGRAGRSAWMDIDWREHQRWVTIDDRAVNVIALGEGPPLVFVHGLSGSWQNWLEQLPVFASRRRVIAFDLPGFGCSPMPTEKISIAGYARTVERLLGKMQIDEAAVVGNSMGGLIAAELAITAPTRVKRLTLISPAGISTEGRNVHIGLLRRLQWLTGACAAWLAARSETVTRRPRLRDATFAIVARHPSRLPGPLLAEQLKGSGKAGVLDALEALISYPIRDRLAGIGCPTLIVWGDRDPLVAVRDADVFARLIPDSRKVIFEDTGHVAMLERPTEFNALLEEFLAG